MSERPPSGLRRRMEAVVTYTVSDTEGEDEFRAVVTDHMLRMFNGYSPNIGVKVTAAEGGDGT